MKTPLISALANSIGIAPGAPFRGRVATFQAQNLQRSVSWTDMHILDHGRVVAAGTDYHMIGMWAYGIPTLFEYSPTMSPAFYRTMTRLFARKDDLQMRNVLVVRRIVPSALAIFGVRYVVTDAPQPAPLQLVMREQATPAETVYLYEVPNPNLGTWGVVGSRKVSSFDAALDAILDPNFDPTRTAILIADVGISDIPEIFAPIEHAMLKVIRGGLRLEASSGGTSLLVLPFEFSHCLSVSGLASGDGKPRLLRVNALETGVVFTGNIRAEIQYFNSPFRDADCRIRDAAEFSRLIGR
jgi:hypothetical protein